MITLRSSFLLWVTVLLVSGSTAVFAALVLSLILAMISMVWFLFFVLLVRCPIQGPYVPGRIQAIADSIKDTNKKGGPK